MSPTRRLSRGAQHVVADEDRHLPIRGRLRMTVRQVQRAFWRVLRVVVRKDWVVEVIEQRGGRSVAVLCAL